MEGLQRLHLFAGADELDRCAAHLANRQGGATTRIAIELGEHRAGDAHLCMERAGELGRLLADHRVDHQQHLVGLHRLADPHHLFHHRRVDLQSTGGVDQHGVEAFGFCFFDAGGSDVLRFGVSPQAEHLHTDLLPQGAQLLNGGGPINIGSHQQGLAPLLLEVQAQLGGGGGLASPLQTRHQDHGGGLLSAGQGGVLATHGEHQLFVDQLDELLIRADTAHHFGTDRLAPHLLDEVLDHQQAHIRLQQGATHLLERFVDVRLRNRGLTPQALDGVFKTLGKFVEHQQEKSGRRSQSAVWEAARRQRSPSRPNTYTLRRVVLGVLPTTLPAASRWLSL